MGKKNQNQGTTPPEKKKKPTLPAELRHIVERVRIAPDADEILALDFSNAHAAIDKIDDASLDRFTVVKRRMLAHIGNVRDAAEKHGAGDYVLRLWSDENATERDCYQVPFVIQGAANAQDSRLKTHDAHDGGALAALVAQGAQTNQAINQLANAVAQLAAAQSAPREAPAPDPIRATLEKLVIKRMEKEIDSFANGAPQNPTTQLVESMKAYRELSRCVKDAENEIVIEKLEEREGMKADDGTDANDPVSRAVSKIANKVTDSVADNIGNKILARFGGGAESPALRAVKEAS